MRAIVLAACSLWCGLPFTARADTQCLNSPSPAYSTTPNTVIACPAGDGSYTVRVMSWPCPPSPDPTAIAGTSVTLDFSCTAFEHCAVAETSPLYDDATSTVRGVTNAQGYMTFHLQMSGGTPDSCVQVSAGAGTLMGDAHLVSPDQNADRQVNATDMAIIESKYGTSDLSADFDGNGLVDPLDLDLALQHLGHQCATAGVPGTGHAAWVAMWLTMGLAGSGVLLRSATARGARAGRPGRNSS